MSSLKTYPVGNTVVGVHTPLLVGDLLDKLVVLWDSRQAGMKAVVGTSNLKEK